VNAGLYKFVEMLIKGDPAFICVSYLAEILVHSSGNVNDK
jgi:hypothetical protein